MIGCSSEPSFWKRFEECNAEEALSWFGTVRVAKITRPIVYDDVSRSVRGLLNKFASRKLAENEAAQEIKAKESAALAARNAPCLDEALEAAKKAQQACLDKDYQIQVLQTTLDKLRTTVSEALKKHPISPISPILPISLAANEQQTP